MRGQAHNATITLETNAPGSCICVLADDAIILGVGSDPEPKNPIRGVDGECPVVHPDSHRVKATHSLEVERRMARIGLEELKLPGSKCANRFWQPVVAAPEARCGMVIQSFRERPA